MRFVFCVEKSHLVHHEGEKDAVSDCVGQEDTMILKKVDARSSIGYLHGLEHW